MKWTFIIPFTDYVNSHFFPLFRNVSKKIAKHFLCAVLNANVDDSGVLVFMCGTLHLCILNCLHKFTSEICMMCNFSDYSDHTWIQGLDILLSEYDTRFNLHRNCVYKTYHHCAKAHDVKCTSYIYIYVCMYCRINYKEAVTNNQMVKMRHSR
jgi:hypothetical protein